MYNSLPQKWLTVFKSTGLAFISALQQTGIINYAIPARSKGGKYLLCYFVGNAPEQERVHLAVSKDGYNFKPLNGNKPVITQTLGKKCMRDPFIVEGKDGCYYIIATDMKSEEGWVSNHALVSWKSTDLINWTDETIIDIRDFGGEFANTNRSWAPQAIWDEKKGEFMVYWTISTAENDCAGIYYAYTTDFKTLTKPEPLYIRKGIQTIDADIVYNEKNGKYYMYYKHEEDQTIAYVTSDSLTGPYDTKPIVCSLAPSGVEGSLMYRITGTGTWVMIMDEYGKKRYFAQQTYDMENFMPLKRKSYNFSFGVRHASLIPISDKQYKKLVKHFGV